MLYKTIELESTSHMMTVQPALASLRNCLAAQPHGRLLAIVQEPGRVALRDRRRPNAEDSKLPTALGDTYRAAACAWSPCGRFLLTAWQGGMGMLTMHKVDEVLHVEQLACEELFFWPKDMAVASKDGSLLVALAGAPGVVLYCREQSEAEGRPPAWQLSQRARLGPMWPACAVSMSADGSALAAAALGSQLHVWDLEPGLDAPLLELQVQVPAERVTAMAFSPDGKYLAAVTWAGSIILCSKSRSRQLLLPELPAVLGKTDTRAAETCEERSESPDNTALPAEMAPRSCASNARAAPDEILSRLAWIDHGTQGAGGWSLACSHLTDAPLKPQVACTSLLAWLDDGCLVASVRGCPVVLFRRCEDRLSRLEGEVMEGSSENLSEGGELSAGMHGIRGLALLSSRGNRLDGMLYIQTCDSLGRMMCRQANKH